MLSLKNNYAKLVSVNHFMHLKNIENTSTAYNIFIYHSIAQSCNCICTRRSSTSSTVDKDEVRKFETISSKWWTSKEFKALHTMNELRVPLVRDKLLKYSNIKVPPVTQSLKGFSILDVGCGGGILCEPLARLGAKVTGIDSTQKNITEAERHCDLDMHIAGKIRYICSPVEKLDPSEHQYDAVIASEIIEHVSEQNLFVASCCNLVKPNGSIFFTTMNQTLRSWLLAVIAAEKILRIVPDGIHDWEKFVPPEDLTAMLSKNNFTVRLVHGMLLNPLSMRWSWISDTSINYAVHATKDVNTESN